MSTIVTPARKPAFSPLRLDERSVAWRVGAVVLGSLFLALSSYIEVPMVPVPVTMQTFAVTLVGALYGWRLGALTIVAWLVEGASGLPVLAGGDAGLHHFFGPTAGYLFAFPLCGALLAAVIGIEKAFAFGFAPFVLGGLLKSALGAATLMALRGKAGTPRP